MEGSLSTGRKTAKPAVAATSVRCSSRTESTESSTLTSFHAETGRPSPGNKHSMSKPMPSLPIVRCESRQTARSSLLVAEQACVLFAKPADLRLWRRHRKCSSSLNRDVRGVFSCGDGRSGTTWLSKSSTAISTIATCSSPSTRPTVPLVKHFRFFQYLRPDNRDEAFLRPARRIVSGAYLSWRIDSLNKRRIATRRLIKDIFSNLFLKWLGVQFPGMPLILVVRHPCAVAASKMNLKDWIWSVNPSDFLDQPDLMADHLEPYRGLIEKTTDDFDKQILHWCLTHYVPFRQFRRGEIHVVAYEHHANAARKKFAGCLHLLAAIRLRAPWKLPSSRRPPLRKTVPSFARPTWCRAGSTRSRPISAAGPAP